MSEKVKWPSGYVSEIFKSVFIGVLKQLFTSVFIGVLKQLNIGE